MERAYQVASRAIGEPVLLCAYRQYLADGDQHRFVSSVVDHYTAGTLERLLVSGDTQVRRAAALAIGSVGDARSLRVLGPALSAGDRPLRLVAEEAFWAIGRRVGTPESVRCLGRVLRCNERACFRQAEVWATVAIESWSATAEVMYQRAVARYRLGNPADAVGDCKEALFRNRFHYRAMVLLGHCHWMLGDLWGALSWLRRALRVFPDQERVRVQARRLQRAIQDL